MTAKKVDQVSVLDEDPGFAGALDEKNLGLARRYARARVIHLKRGCHDPNAVCEPDGLLGLLVVDGILIRQVRVGDRQSGELVGHGAVLRPWDDFGREAPLPFEVSWRVLEDTRIACLDRRFLATIVHWPALVDALIERIVERAQTLAFNVAIHALRHVDLRLLVLLWHLADRFGSATPDGIRLPLRLSHADLAALVGTARPSVSVALNRLSADGLLWRDEVDRTWVLPHEPPDEVRDLRSPAASVGAT